MAEEMSVANKEKLVSDLKVVISDTEELLRATAGAAGEKVVFTNGCFESQYQLLSCQPLLSSQLYIASSCLRFSSPKRNHRSSQRLRVCRVPSEQTSTPLVTYGLLSVMFRPEQGCPRDF